MSGAHLSKDFFELIKNIGECKSKQEEEKIVSNEVTALRQRLSESPASLGLKRSKEAIVRVMYVEMLGHSADFGHIHAVNMTQQTNLLCKRVGYLACSLCLHPEHELITLLVNTMRRDLKSSNHLEVCAALIAVSKLVNTEIMPAVIECITDLLEHTHEVVRKKAVMALHRMHIVQPGCLAGMTDKLRRVLCDKDPAVMGASLHALHALLDEEPAAFKDLVPSFVSILKQITEHRLPSSFDYHRMPAPWIQIKLLRVLSSLGLADQGSSEHMYEVLYDVLKRADTGINIGYAVIYECVRTITAIYPNVQLMETAANHISRFVSSENHNLKYLGIKALASIVQVNQKYALEHQLVVVECMEDPDETLKRKTLDLLFQMTNASNVVFVVDKLVYHLRQTSDQHFRGALVERITQLAERYAPDNAWFITTMNYIFELGGDVVHAETAHNLLRLIAEGGGEDEDADAELRLHAVRAYRSLLSKSHIPDVLMKVVCWTLGEYGYLSDEFELEELLETLCDVMERQFSEPDTRAWVMSAITKLVAQLPSVPDQVVELATKFCASQSVSLQQYCSEFLALAQDPAMMAEVLPVDSSCDDLEVDPALGFLDGFVEAAVRRGAARYIRPQDRPDELQVGASAGHHPAAASAAASSGLRFDEYANPAESVRAIGSNGPSELGGGGAELGLGGAARASGQTGLNTAGVAKRWGAEGYGTGKNGDGSAPAPPAPPASTAAPSPGWAPQPAAAPTAPAAPTGAAPRPAPAPPPPMTEKEKMAAALFGGMGPTARAAAAEVSARQPAATTGSAAKPGAAAAAAAAKEKKAKAKEKKRTDKAPAAGAAAVGGSSSVGDLLGDLLDLEIAPEPTAPSAVPAPAPTTNQAPPAGYSAEVDLLSLVDQGPQLAPSAPPSAGLGGLAAMGGAAAPAPPQPAAAAPLDMLMLQQPVAAGVPGVGGMGLSALDGSAPETLPTPMPLSPTLSAQMAPGGAAAPPPMHGAAMGAGGGAAERSTLASDGHMRLTLGQELRPDAVAFELGYVNLGHAPLRNITLNLEPPAQLHVVFAGAPPSADVRGHRLAIPLLHGGQAVSHAAVFTCADVPTPQMRVAGFVSYMEDKMGANEQRNLAFHINLPIEHVLRPKPASTQQFGEQWGSHGNQRKFTVATKTVSLPQQFMDAMEKHLRLAPVQVIGQECIMCGSVIGSGATVLVHAKVGLNNGSAIEVTVRTRDNRMSDAIQRLTLQALSH